MGTYIGLLLLVMPGFVARKLYKQINDVRDDLSQFDETMYCLLNSVVIMAILLTIMGVVYLVTPSQFNFRISNFTALFDNIIFIVDYAVISFGMAVIVGLITPYAISRYEKIVNSKRKLEGRKNLLLSKTVFDSVFCTDRFIKFNDGKSHEPLVELYKDDKFIGRGFLMLANEHDRDFYLANPEKGIKEINDNFGKLPPLAGIYYDAKTGVSVKIYDLTKLGE